MASEAGKGDKQRPTDHQKYAHNWDVIFGKKEKTPCGNCDKCKCEKKETK
jgi:hypothetical protein